MGRADNVDVHCLVPSGLTVNRLQTRTQTPSSRSFDSEKPSPVLQLED